MSFFWVFKNESWENWLFLNNKKNYKSVKLFHYGSPAISPSSSDAYNPSKIQNWDDVRFNGFTLPGIKEQKDTEAAQVELERIKEERIRAEKELERLRRILEGETKEGSEKKDKKGKN